MSDDESLARFREWRLHRQRAVRNQLVEEHTGFALHVARRFRRSMRDEDIDQVALVALVKAVERFDPERGVPFTAFAGRTIEGELKRHLRDTTWAARVPRRAQELHLAVRGGVETLSARLGRAPTVDELATHLDVPTDHVLLGLSAAEARASASIDAASGDGGAPMAANLAAPEAGDFDHVDDVDEVARLLVDLPPRDREILRLRFYEELSQQDIGDRLGLSQMHVSRLLRAALDRLRQRRDD